MTEKMGALEKKLYEGKITRLDYIEQQSEQVKQEYERYCSERGLQKNDESACTYMEWSLKQEEAAHTDYLD